MKQPLFEDFFPARIEVLGLILVLSLMVWRLMERTMRLSLPNQQLQSGRVGQKTHSESYVADDHPYVLVYGGDSNP